MLYIALIGAATTVIAYNNKVNQQEIEFLKKLRGTLIRAVETATIESKSLNSLI